MSHADSASYRSLVFPALCVGAITHLVGALRSVREAQTPSVLQLTPNRSCAPMAFRTRSHTRSPTIPSYQISSVLLFQAPT